MDLLKYEIWFHSNIGVIHTAFAVIAMIAGLWVVFKPKGTKLHKRIGYTYVISMLSLCISSFWMHTFGTFGIFHFASVVSLLGIIGGMIPALLRTRNWLGYHYHFMSWSVVGLYAAFWSEVGTRIFDMRYFWWAVAVATFLTVFIGSKIISKNAKKLIS